MMILTAKVSKGKLAAALLLLVAVVVLAVVLLHRPSAAGAESSASPGTPAEVRTNDDRVAFLASYGWEVTAEPVKTQEVRIPSDPSEVFDRYNRLQISQGYDLSRYAGETVRRYVYEITNYPDAEGSYCATLLVRDGSVIGGDVSSQAAGGVMHGFRMPAAAGGTADAASADAELPDGASVSATG